MAMYKCPKAIKKRIKCELKIDLTFLKYNATSSAGLYAYNSNPSDSTYSEIITWYADDVNNTIQLEHKEPSVDATIISTSISSGANAYVKIAAPTFDISTKKLDFKFNLYAYNTNYSYNNSKTFSLTINIDQNGQFVNCTRTEFTYGYAGYGNQGSSAAFAKATISASDNAITYSTLITYTKE